MKLRVLLPFIVVLALSLSPTAVSLSQSMIALPVAKENDDFTGIIKHLNVILLFEPWRSMLWEEKAMANMSLGDWEEAISAFQEAEAHSELSLDGKIAYGRAYEHVGELTKALGIWNSLIEAQQASPEVFDLVVKIQMDSGNIEAAIRALKSWHSVSPKDAQVLYQLGLLLSITKPEQALTYLQQAASYDAAYSANVLALEQAIQTGIFSDEEGYRWLLIGRTLGSIGEWHLGLIAFQRSVEASPDYAEAWAFYGEAREQVGESGYTALQNALAIDPDSIIARALMALYWRRAGNPEAALSLLQDVARQEPDQPIWQVEIGNILLASGDLPSAMAYYANAVTLAPENSYYWQLLATFCVANNYQISAIGLPAARKAVLLSPEDPAALDIMGWLLYNLEDFISAERFLQRALTEDPDLPIVHLHLGQVYLQLEDQNKAYAHLSQAIKLSDPGSDIERLASRLLWQHFGVTQ